MSLIEDPVIALGRCHVEFDARWVTLDEASLEAPEGPESEVAHRRMEAAADATIALREVMSFTPATSLVGALLQSRILFDLVDDLDARIEDGKMIADTQLRLTHLAASIMRTLERATSTPREAFGGNELAPLRSDPFGPEPAFVAAASDVRQLVTPASPVVTLELLALLTDAREIIAEYQEGMLNGIGHGPERPVPEGFEFKEDIEYLDGLLARIDGVLPPAAPEAEPVISAIAAE